MSHKATGWAIQQRGLKPATKLLLWHLADRHNKDTRRCDPSQDLLAEDCEMSRASVNRHLDELERAGLIRRVKRFNGQTKRQENTFYLLAFDSDFSVSQNETRAVSQNEQKPCLKNGESRVSNCDTNLVKEPVKNQRAGATELETLAAAARFWGEKIAAGKPVAISAITVDLAQRMLALELVKKDELRKRGIPF